MKTVSQNPSYEVNRSLEHLLLEPQLTEAETLAGCSMASSYGLGSVCVKPCYVRAAAALLRNESIALGTVIAFPYGSSVTHSKVVETKRALTEGAIELSLSINFGTLLDEKTILFCEDIKAVCGLAHMNGAKANVIIDVDLITQEQFKLAGKLALEAGADWISPTSGFLSGIVAPQYYQWLRDAVGEKVQIKAMGPLNSHNEYLTLIDHGVRRVAAPLTKTILEDILEGSK